MAKMGRVNSAELKKLQKQMEQLQEAQTQAFVEACAKELAARMLAKVIRRTPVGDYSKEIEVTAKRDSKHHKKGDIYTKRVNPSGKVGGTLRRAWICNTEEEAKSKKGAPQKADIDAFVDSMQIQHVGKELRIVIENPMDYAEYVEYGHRTRGHKGWVPGKLMMTESERELQTIAPKLLEKKVLQFLQEVFS